MFAPFALVLSAVLAQVSGHACIFHPSMYGFNVTAGTYAYDNRPVTPLRGKTFSEWWFHGHLDHPPNPGDIFKLPAGKPARTEIACHKAATSYFNSSESGDIREANNPNNPCPGEPTIRFHTNGTSDLQGCALAIAYESDINKVQPNDLTIFSVNHTCVWTRFTDFKVPKRMPPCPKGGCICAFFWIHSPLTGGDEIYMNGFRCEISGSTSNVPLAKPKVPRRCGADRPNNRLKKSVGNCTYGAKTPFYWVQKEGNNVFEGIHSPPVYNDLYNFDDGAQDDIFQGHYVSIPKPKPGADKPVVNPTMSYSTPPTPSRSTDNPNPKPSSSSSRSSRSNLSTRTRRRTPTPSIRYPTPSIQYPTPSTSNVHTESSASVFTFTEFYFWLLMQCAFVWTLS